MLHVTLNGQLCSGKNAVLIGRNGQHYSAVRFRTWREDAFIQLRAKGVIPLAPYAAQARLRVEYWPGDRRTRDVSGMLDALFHLLVYSRILKDDGLVRDVFWRYQGVDEKNPRVAMNLEAIG